MKDQRACEFECEELVAFYQRIADAEVRRQSTIEYSERKFQRQRERAREAGRLR